MVNQHWCKGSEFVMEDRTSRKTQSKKHFHANESLGTTSWFRYRSTIGTKYSWNQISWSIDSQTTLWFVKARKLWRLWTFLRVRCKRGSEKITKRLVEKWRYRIAQLVHKKSKRNPTIEIQSKSGSRFQIQERKRDRLLPKEQITSYWRKTLRPMCSYLYFWNTHWHSSFENDWWRINKSS